MGAAFQVTLSAAPAISRFPVFPFSCFLVFPLMPAKLDLWILACSLITVAVTIWMGFRSARSSKSASDFFVAGRSVSVGWNASAISGEYLSAASFMGVAGMVMSSGYDALWYPVCYACGYLFLLLFIAGPLRRFGAYTIPDFAEGRFDSPLFRKIAVIFVLFIGFFYTMPQMKGAGTTLAYIFPDLPYWAGVVLVGAVITLNVALGGMKGITLVQAVQYWIKLFAISAPVFVLVSVYGGYNRHLEVNSDVTWVQNRAGSTELKPLVLKGKDRLEPGDRQAYRLGELPAKAPQDGTWLNPFGPLTTKAARAALSRRPTDAELIAGNPALASQMQALGKRIYADHLLGLLARVQDALKQSPPVQWRTMVTPGWTNITAHMPAPLLAYAAATGKPVIWNTNLAAMKPFPLDVSHTQATTDAGFADQIARQLAARGIALVPTSQGPVLAVDAGQLQRLRDGATVPSEASLRPYALLYTYSLIIALVCGTAGLPHILVRFYTNPDGVAAKRTTMWVMILIGVFYVFPPVFGVMGRNLMPSLYEGAGAKGTDKVVLELPKVLDARDGGIWETGKQEDGKTGVTGSVPSSSSPVFPSSSAAATGASGGIPWGSILSGITCAGAFAAFMSTFSGLLVSMTGALAHDVYGRMLRPQSTPAERMRMFKFCAVGVGTVAVVLGSFVEPLEINFMVGQAFAIAAASYFPLLFMSVWWRGMTMRGAAAGMLTGGVCALAAVTLTNFSDLKWLPLGGFWAAHPLLRILCEQPAIWTVPLAIGLMVVVSKLTRAGVPGDIRLKMLVLHAPEKLGLKQEYIREHEGH
jgi:Na+(H+)/acetate symporter ActP